MSMAAGLYPKMPQPNAAVQITEKATTAINHRSSFFIMHLVDIV